MSICKHASSAAHFPLPYFPVGKKADLMFPNIYSSMVTVTIQVTSTLQSKKQWNLYFFLLMVFCQFTFNPIQNGRRGEVQKGSLLVSCNTFWLLVSILFPHSRKISGSYLVLKSNYWTWTKTTPQKNCFFFFKSV